MPTREQVQRALQAIKRYADYEYFFNELKSAAWIEPLLQADMFKTPPSPIREGSFVRFPLWPESRYLARVASTSPELVLRVIRQIPETENVRVHEDFIDAALAMPAAVAASLVDQAIRWLNSPYELLLPHKLGELLGHLARGNQIAPGLKLAGQLLALQSPPAAEGKTQAGREPQPRFREYEYKRILKRQMPLLVRAAARLTADLLSEILENANRIAARDETLEEEGVQGILDDYSYVWRPAIEEHEQNHDYDIRESIVAALRDALETVASGDPTGLAALVLSLEQRRWLIFYRLALQLLRRFPEAAPGALVERVTDEARFEDHRLRHEYGALLRNCFTGLPGKAQARILARVDAGPALDSFTIRATEHYGRPPTEEEEDRYVKGWKLEMLALIGMQQLPALWQQRYTDWARNVGEPEHPDFPVYSGATWVGPTSPKSSADLASMSVAEIVSFLVTWEPSREWMSPSREGVGRELQKVVAEAPQRFVEQAEAFQALHPTYVSALLSGLRDASKDKTFDWRPVLRLCEWIVRRSPADVVTTEPSANEDEEEDSNWNWLRSVVAGLLERACMSGASQAPIELRSKLWRVLLPLTRALEPTPEYEARYGGSNMDPSTLALNTTRGKAMLAVMRYASWVRHPSTQGLQTETPNEIPEVWEVLHEHLDPVRDPSLAIRSVYGQWLPWLITWNRPWVESHLRMIFPPEDALAGLCDAAWDSYVIFSPAYNDAFEVLREEYGAAIDRMNRPRQGRELADPNDKLGEHLIVLYWRGRLPLSDDADALLGRFYERASASVRRHVMRFTGISLENTKDDVPADILERIQTFWLWRVEQLRGSQAALGFEELAEFGWWFASGKLETRWALDQLSRALTLAGRVEPENQVLEKLAVSAGDIPQRAIQMLRMMIEGATEPWRVLGCPDEIRGILSAALRSKDSRAAEMAVDLIHDLGARNIRDFADLLKK